MPLLFAVLLLVAAPSASATVYKCTAETGGIVYQDTPCGPGKELRNLDTDPATLSVVPGTPLPSARPAPPASPKPERPTRAAKHGVKAGAATERKFIRAGMTEAEVIFKIGRPEVETHGRGRQGKQWSYLPASGDPDTITTLTIVGGKVASVDRKVAR